jgi:hypothetical protein
MSDSRTFDEWLERVRDYLGEIQVCSEIHPFTLSASDMRAFVRRYDELEKRCQEAERTIGQLRALMASASSHGGCYSS